MNLIKKNIKSNYRNGPDNIGRDFVGPCLSSSKLYRRGTGFFSSGALISYVEAIDNLVTEKTKIEIICSPVISDRTLLTTLENNQTEDQRRATISRLSNTVVLAALGYKINTERRDYKKELLAYFIAKEIIKIKFAVPKNFKELNYDEKNSIETNNLYHVKTGYFLLEDESIVAFDGSFNESDSGHQYHLDKTQVWRSWIPEDTERLRNIKEEIDEDWRGENKYIEIYDLSKEAFELAKKMSPNTRPIDSNKIYTKPVMVKVVENGLRKYQEDTLNCWKLNNYKGIFELATGTGKTRTAIEAIKKFNNTIKNTVIIITVPYRPLAHQWMSILSNNEVSCIGVFDSKDKWSNRVQNIFEGHINNIKSMRINPVIVCVNKSFNEELFQSYLLRLNKRDSNKLIIVDECHHYNNKERINYLPNSFNYRIGLSATPYESEEEKILDKYFDKIVYTYTLRQAIDENILCPYKYNPIFVELTDSEASKYLEIRKKIQKEKITKESNLGEIDSLLENLVAKLAHMQEILVNKGRMPYTLFYCGTGNVELDTGEEIRQINSVTRLLNNLNWTVSKITSNESNAERELIIDAFKNKTIDAIASIRVLDEGIDIPDCRTAFILASQRIERQGIQRRGRILRKSFGKEYAELYDFIIAGPNLSDAELLKLYDRELRRAKLFAEDALNKDECYVKINNY